MYGRAGLDRFKKSQTLEPFSVSANSASNSKPPITNQSSTKTISNAPQTQISRYHTQFQDQHNLPPKSVEADANAALSGGQTQQVTQLGAGQSTWQPPDWAIEPRPGVYYLEVLKDGQVLDRINLDRRKQIFGRQHQTCDFVLDHQSVSRQHAAVVPHKNGSVYVIDMGSAHGTFVANERLTKDTPMELEAGQSLRFAASTRTYILRKNTAALFPRPPPPTEINMPPPPDPSDEEALVAYNTLLNRYGLTKADLQARSDDSGTLPKKVDDNQPLERAAKRIKRLRVAFRDQSGGELVEVVGISDGADVETEPGPIGVKEGSLVGKYESLVQVTVIPRGKEQISAKEANTSPQTGVTDKLQEVLKKVKSTPKTGIYDDLYGDSFSSKVGTSWAYSSASSVVKVASPPKDAQEKANGPALETARNVPESHDDDDDNDDLFG